MAKDDKNKFVGGPYRAVAASMHREGVEPMHQPDCVMLQGWGPKDPVSLAITFQRGKAGSLVEALGEMLGEVVKRFPERTHLAEELKSVRGEKADAVTEALEEGDVQKATIAGIKLALAAQWLAMGTADGWVDKGIKHDSKMARGRAGNTQKAQKDYELIREEFRRHKASHPNDYDNYAMNCIVEKTGFSRWKVEMALGKRKK